jgi:predicted RNA-binding protein YlxR (DUF448 family)
MGSEGQVGRPGPVRTCLGCRGAYPLAEGRLVRIAVGPEGSLAVSRTLPGRGVWLCGDDHRCHERALRPKVLLRALRVGTDELAPGAVDRLRSHFPAVGTGARD